MIGAAFGSASSRRGVTSLDLLATRWTHIAAAAAFLALTNLAASGSPAVAGTTAPSTAGLGEICRTCHEDEMAAHVRAWQESVHARFGVTCGACHLLRRGEVRHTPVSQDGPPACAEEHRAPGAACESCHWHVAQAFHESAHFARTGRGPVTPTCVDCHSSASGSVLAADALPQRCGACHSVNGPAGRAWVAEQAPSLLQLLQRVTLARAVVNDQIGRLERAGDAVGPDRLELQRIESHFRDLAYEWHRFNLPHVEQTSRLALRRLEALNERLTHGRPVAAGTESALSLPPAAGPQSGVGQPLRLAVASIIDPVATYDAYVALLTDMGNALGRPVRFVQRRTYQEINDLLVRGELDLAFVCSGAYAALPEDAPVEIVALPVVRGHSIYHSLIIVQHRSPIETFDDLRGKRFAFTDPLSNTGYLYPTFRVASLGTTPDQFFGSTLFSGSHDRSVRAVYRDLVDAAAVDDLVFQRLVAPGSPYWGHLRVIESSPDFAIPPVVAPTAVPAALRAQMRAFLLDLPRTPAGRARLAPLGFDGFVTGRPDDYAPIRRMLRSAPGSQR